MPSGVVSTIVSPVFQLDIFLSNVLTIFQNWVSVAKTLRQQLHDEDRPSDWYSQKNCALQYNRLLEMVEKPARKKKRPSGQSEDLLCFFSWTVT